MGRLSELPNIGSVLEKKLQDAGINTPEELKETGSKEAFIRIIFNEMDGCYSMLCAIEGAIQGLRWHNLSKAVKADLKEFYKGIKL